MQSCGVAADQLDFAIVAPADSEGVPHMARLRPQHLGSRRTPAKWASVTAFPQYVLGKLLRVWMGIYVDDCFCAEPADPAQSAFRTVKEAVAMFCFPLSPPKEVPPTKTIDVLGSSAAISGPVVSAALPDRKINEYRALISNSLERNNLPPPQPRDCTASWALRSPFCAASLVGK